MADISKITLNGIDYNVKDPNLSNYYTKAQTDSAITSATENLAGKQWVEDQGYLTEHQDLSDYAKTTAVTQAVQTAMASETARTEDTYAKLSTLGDTVLTDTKPQNNYLQFFGKNTSTGAGTTKNVYFKTINGEGLVNYNVSTDISLPTFNDVSTAITDSMETETARTESVYAKKSEIPDLDGYWTSAQTQNAITAATDNMATETWVQNQGYLTQHQDISGKLDKTDFNTYTGATETAIAGKQDTLVSGTNIKTINNQSLLGSGNIDIQGGGGGGGETVVELTKAEYEALNPPAADTTYIITDADVVDLNSYAPASGLTELSGTVETLSSTKADKANTTARNGYYFPTWNAQGIIIGTYAQVYSKSQSINGTNYSVISTSNSSHPSIYAPTSAGTAGQPLLSNGSGAPVWGGYKFAFITQTQYDALSTKDATTIYFITGD